mgnify:CR=1 FL=1
MFKATINVLNNKYTSWSTEPADMSVDVNNIVTVLKAIKAAGNYGAVITFDKEEKGGDKDDF